MYGNSIEISGGHQDETTPFWPRSPYGVAKLYAYWITVNFRESYGIHASNGILFNHESPIRGKEFVTRKITDGVAKIKCGLADKITLGNLDSRRDWGFAGDFVEAMWLMLQQEKADDYVLATNKTYSIKEFIEECCKVLNINYKWVGTGLNEKLINIETNKIIIEIDEKYFRPSEVDLLIGDYSKAKKILGWEPKIKFEDLVKKMINGYLNNYKK